VRVILVVLALIWVVALTPTILRKIAEREGSYSVARFHRHLRAMRRAYPAQVAAVGSTGAGVSLGLDGTSMASGIGSQASGRPRPVRADATAAPAVRNPGPSARRRRQVLATLGAGLVLSFLFGLIPPVRFFWDVSLLLLAMTVGYLALLIHFRRVAVERAEKVVRLEPPAPVPLATDTAPIPRVQPYLPGEAPAFRAGARVRIAGAQAGG
jgi:hypothetical protein